MNNKLEEIVKYAYDKVPFYVKLLEELNLNIEGNNFDEIWDKVPVIDKNMMLDCNSGSNMSAEYVYLSMTGKLIQISTSGSTGKCMDIFWDEKDIRKSLLPLWIYRKRYHNINPDDKRCYFYTMRKVGYDEIEMETVSSGMGFSKCSLDKEKMKQIYLKMLEYQPKWLWLQPSLASLLVQCIKENNLPKIDSLKYIEMTGEMLFEETKKEIKEVFGCDISNQYGCCEANSIAYECCKGHLHCVNSNVYVEIMEDGKKVEDGVEGDVVITCLHNHAMPMIRYNIGDRAILYPSSKCSCGSKNPVLELTTGRSNDFVLNEDGSRVNTYIFVRAIENVNRVMEYIIKQFQIVQEDYNRFTVKLVLDEETDEGSIEELFVENLVQPSLADAIFNFEYYDRLFPDDKNGKLLYFRNRLLLNVNG